MTNQEVQALQLGAMTQRLLADIQRRGLTVGDRYLTTDELSRMLGVRKAAVGKAVRHLAERGILIPRQRSGTFIGPGFAKQKRSSVRTVFVLLPAGDPAATRWAYQPFVAGIRSAIPEVNVQFTFIPENDPLPYVRELLDGPRAAGQFAGVVSVSSPPEVYSYLAELRVPAVVYGSPYSMGLPIAAVDLDNFQSGQLLTRYLIDRGHRRLALLTTGAGRPGNDLFHDGVNDALTAAGLAPNALVQRSVRSSIDALRAMAEELFQRPARPTAIITRGVVQADAIASVASAVGLAIPRDAEIVLDDEGLSTAHVDVASYPHVKPKMAFAEIAATIGKALLAMSDEVPSRGDRILIPVEFQEAEPRA